MVKICNVSSFLFTISPPLQSLKESFSSKPLHSYSYQVLHVSVNRKKLWTGSRIITSSLFIVITLFIKEQQAFKRFFLKKNIIFQLYGTSICISAHIAAVLEKVRFVEMSGISSLRSVQQGPWVVAQHPKNQYLCLQFDLQVLQNTLAAKSGELCRTSALKSVHSCTNRKSTVLSSKEEREAKQKRTHEINSVACQPCYLSHDTSSQIK